MVAKEDNALVQPEGGEGTGPAQTQEDRAASVKNVCCGNWKVNTRLWVVVISGKGGVVKIFHFLNDTL